MSSMGGNLGLYGNMEKLNAGPIEALEAGASITGVGIDPEGVDNNPAYHTFLLESAWRSTKVDVGEWLQQWSDQRCGRVSAKARAAWAILGRTVYANAEGQTYENIRLERLKRLKYSPPQSPPRAPLAAPRLKKAIHGLYRLIMLVYSV